MSVQSEAERAFEQLRLQAKAQMEVNKSAESYLNTVSKIGKIQKNIKALSDSIAELKKKDTEADKLALKLAEEKLEILKDQNEILIEAVKNVNKTVLAAEVGVKVLEFGYKALKDTWGKIKSSGLFEMDKAVRSTGLSMGIVKTQTDELRKSIFDSAIGVGKLDQSTINLGVGMQDLAKIQADYSEQIGRAVTFTRAGNVAMAQLAKGTTLGAEGAAAMVSSMDFLGKNAQTARDYIQSAVQDSHESGVNSSTVIKNIKDNIGLLNKYNFKSGSQGLKEMAINAAKMQSSMQLAAPMADKLFNVEGAVEMSAQLQVLGGRWAALADPFKLMFMARNDMNALNTSIIDAVKSTATFNKETKEFDIAPLEMQRLRAVAQATGLDFEQLAKSAKKAAAFSKIDSQIKLNVDQKTKSYIESISSLDENGNATIHVQGEVGDKLVSALTSTEMSTLANTAKQKESLDAQAKNAQTFDDALTNTINLFKTAMLPVVENLNNVLIPFVRRIFDNPDFKKDLVSLGQNIGSFIGGVAGVVKSFANIAMHLGPGGTLATLFGGKLLFNALKWYSNGEALGMGFLTVAKSGIAGNAGGGVGFGTKMGKNAGWAAGLGIASAGTQLLTNQLTDKGSTANKIGNIASDTLMGASFGRMFGVWGAGIGAAIGGLYGLIKENMDDKNDFVAPQIEPPVSDAIFHGKNSKNYTKGRGIIENGRITPIDNQDDLIAAKSNGIIDKNFTAAKSNTLDVNFGDINLNGSIILKSDSNTKGVDITSDLLKNSEFIRNITKMVHVETSKAINGGKISGQPSF